MLIIWPQAQGAKAKDLLRCFSGLKDFMRLGKISAASAAEQIPRASQRQKEFDAASSVRRSG